MSDDHVPALMAAHALALSARTNQLTTQMVDDAFGFSKVLKNRNLLRTFGQLQQDSKLLRPPKGFDADAEHIEFIKLKSFFVWTELELDLNAPELLLPQLAAGLKDALPLVNWLRGARERDEEQEPR